MQVILVSRCEKKALKKTRHVLDAFADRIGDNTWRTLITQNGLLAVKNMLRKTATKNTAVSCHWIRSNSQHELLWLVGQRHKFNPITGVAPVNTTKKNLLNMYEENDWNYLSVIKNLIAIVALLHDWGKANKFFQEKLIKLGFISDPLRHEWISTLLFVAFVKLNKNDKNDDTTWLEQLAKGNIDSKKIISSLLKMQSIDDKYLNLPPIANLVAWLILSHHRLPTINKDETYRIKSKTIKQLIAEINARWGYENTWKNDNSNNFYQCFQFDLGILENSDKWIKQLKRFSQKLLTQQQDLTQCIEDGSVRVILHHARLSLMLGDHNFSSQGLKKDHKIIANALYANTDPKSKQLKQQLSEHLRGVCVASCCIATMLPTLEAKMPTVKNIKNLTKPSPKNYKWQDDVAKTIKKHRQQDNNQKNGFFGVNIASTGKGKTHVNPKIMLALSKDNELRYSLALGLRTLTLQTGDEYQDKIGLDNSELAVLIGSQTVEELHTENKQEQNDKKPSESEFTGSESSEEIFDEQFADELREEDAFYPEVTGIAEEKLSTILTTKKQRKLLYAPIVVCTIDHLMPAVEAIKGGRYILPSLRLMSADLVIDEIDDFTGKDVIAISRLVLLAAMLGRKVMISSATIPPDLAKNYFRVYQQGWLLYCKTRDTSSKIDCAWIDEFNTKVTTIVDTESTTACTEYQQQHGEFITKRIRKLNSQLVKRKAMVVYVENINAKYDADKQQNYFSLIAVNCQKMHQWHSATDNKTNLNVSFGLVRIANITPAVELTQFLLDYQQLEQNTVIRVMVYHSNHTLLLRNKQEQHLDDVVKTRRKSEDSQMIYQNNIIRKHLDDIHKQQPEAKNVIFILVASPVIEVGRDHDYDWAILEPSSARSIIQTPGRVVRHRDIICKNPNIAILQYNIKALKNNNPEKDICFTRPGYEDKNLNLILKSHDLTKIVDTEKLAERIDASWRISKPERKDFKHLDNMAHLEHAATAVLLRDKKEDYGPTKINGYITEPWYLTGCPQKFIPFREQTGSNIKLCLIYNVETNNSYFASYEKGKLVKNNMGKPAKSDITSNIEILELTKEQKQRLWLNLDFKQQLVEYINTNEATYKYAYGDLSSFEYNKYQYCDQLGLVGIKKDKEDC